MRSFLLAVALAAPLSAVAATPNYSNPMSTAHRQAEQMVFLTFVNYTVQDRELIIGDKEYKIPFHSKVNVYVPVGSPVFMFSDTNSKVNGQELMRVSTNDKDTNVFLK